jgi:putative PIN family toxin of toxin-antitoxin system
MRIRVVADTNIFVAAALKPGGPTDMWLRIAGQPRSSFELFVSDQILDEVKEKLIAKFSFSQERTENFVSAIRERAALVVPTESLAGTVSDPDDDMILECAIAAKAQLIISADQDLLKLNPFRGIGISHPRELKNIFHTDLRTSN